MSYAGSQTIFVWIFEEIFELQSWSMSCQSHADTKQPSNDAESHK